MKQIYRALVVAALLVATGPALALGLGKLEQESSLNERFEGRIQLLSAKPDELSTLKVGLADPDAFRRAGINYVPVLRDLKFKLVEPESGPDYVHITSNQPIREPFLNFLVELTWSSGRIYREYTVLLDPPTYDPGPSATAASPSTAERTPAEPSKYSHTVIYPEDRPSGPARSAYTPSYSGGDYGPVGSGETLWSIANAMKPATVTTHQMMLALLRANPDAFIGNNINGLKRGAILRVPSADQMNALSQGEALEQVKSQHGLWESARQSVAAAPAERAKTASPAPASPAAGETVATGDEPESRLELVGAEQGAASQTGDAQGSGADADQRLEMANEKLESLSRENAELRERLAENEALIEDLKRLIALKDDELASLQDRTAEETTAADAPSAPQVEGVQYPNGDPGQFIKDVPPMGDLVPGPVPPAEEISHTVMQPEAAPAQPAPEPAAEPEGEQAAAGAAAEAEPTEPAAKTAAREAAAPAAGGGIMGMVTGLLGSARDFVLNNLMIAGGVVLALILIVAGMSFARQRQARIEEEADAGMAAGTFPDFAASADMEQTSFEDDSESATEMNAAETAAESAEAEDDDATVLTAEAGEDDDDLFVVPQGEAEPSASAAEEDEEDPLAEVNVLMAYEHFDQAESFVRNALKSDPENVEYHAKLLEVFYASGNKKKYEEAARQLHELTGGQGEHWDMAVAMWQELSPNRALFEGGGEEEEPAEASAGGGGIVDITGDTAGGDEEAAEKGEDTGAGGLDFDLGDSTGAGAAADQDEEGMLDLTASEEQAGDEEMLDLTASQDAADDDMLDLTAASAPDEEVSDETQAMDQVSGAQQEDALDVSLDSDSGSDLLDVTHSGQVESSEDLLDVTAAGKAEDNQESPEQEEDDGSLDFSLDMDTGEEPAAGESKSEAHEDDNMLEFDGELGLDSGEDQDKGEAVGSESEEDGAESDDFSLDLDTSDREADTGEEEASTEGLDEISEELDRLEHTLGTLSQQDATKGFGSDTSDALKGIDSALGERDESEESAAGGEADDSSADELDISLSGLEDETEDTSSADELDVSPGDSETETEDTSSENLDISLEGLGPETTDEPAAEEDLDVSAGGLDEDTTDSSSDDLDISLEGLESGAEDTGDDLSDLSIELEDSGGEDEVSAELSELSESLDSGDLDLGEEDSGISLDSGGEDESSMDFDLETGSPDSSAGDEPEIELDEEGSEAETLKTDAVESDTESAGDLDLDLSTDDMSAPESIDMDATVELPKDKLGAGLSLEGDEDDEDDKTVFVGRSGDTEEQSLEDELTTKLDLAKAYVELGDSDSARGILEEVMKDGNDDQKRQAGELLSQI